MTRYRCLHSLVIMLGLLLAVRPAWADDSKKILADLQKKYQSVQDLTIRFSQHVQFGVTRNEDTFEGTMIVKKGNKYRIELQHQTVVTDGKSVWSYSPDNGQVIIDKFREDPRAITPDKVLVNVPDRFSTTLIGTEEKGDTELAVIRLTPKDQSSNLQWMKVWVDTDNWLLRKVQFQDISDNITTYTVEDIRINTGVADKQFQFQPPAEAQVIDLRE